MPLTLVSREEWGAHKPAWTEPLPNPVPYVVLKYYTRSEPCFNDRECKLMMRKLQHIHQKERTYPDIKYNFLIGGNGTVYEGRGWTTNPTKQDIRFQDFYFCSIDIAYIGDFQKEEPPPAMVQAAKDLIEYGLRANFIREDYELIENKKDGIMPYDPGYEEAYADEHRYQNTPY